MKFVSEIFGFNSNFKDLNINERKNYLCPFQKKNTSCDPVNKKSNLIDNDGNKLLDHQTGACSCNYKSSGNNTFKPVIICPFRFLEKDQNKETKVFKKIKDFFYKNDEITFVKEVGLGPYGQADYMIAKFDKKKNIIDFGHCEFQADATTGTRGIVECVKDFYDKKNINKNYSFGLNTKATIKGFSLQMIDKGYLFQKLKKPSIWVMQDNLIQVFSKIYNLKLNEEKNFNDKSENNIFILETKLKENKKDNKFDLDLGRILSTNPKKIQNALSNKGTIPEKKILESIKSRYENR